MGSASINQTSGIGHHYEDHVAAYLLAAALLGAEPRAGLEPAERLEFQVAASGWSLDDLLYVGCEGSRLALSIKSAPQITAAGVPADFVAAAWAELLSETASPFRESHDLLGLAAPPPEPAVGKCLDELTRWAVAQDDATLVARIEQPGAVNDIHRTLWTSLQCPDDLANSREAQELSPGRLLRELRFIGLDLLSPSSADGARGVLWCRLALADPARGKDLWEALLGLVAKARIAGGTIEVAAVAGTLTAFDFRERLDFRADWQSLRQTSSEAQRRVKETISGVSVEREEEFERLAAATIASPTVALTGPSGCGKTALARRWLQRADGEALWLGSEELLRIDQGAAGLGHRLTEILEAAPGGVSIVIDGLDRQFEEATFSLAARLIELSEQRGFRLVLTCQEQEWSRVGEVLRSLNAAATWELVAIGPFDSGQVAQVFREVPGLAELSVKSRLGELLRRPKVLDLFAARISDGRNASGEGQASEDEATVAGWFWEMCLGGGAERQRRGALLLALARDQGDRLRSTTPLAEIADPSPVDGLSRDGILEQVDGRVSFAHDLYGDWIRYQALLSHREDLAGFLEPRAQSPLWGRAIRLYAVSLLDADPGHWAEELEKLGAGGSGLINDLFLDAAIFAADPEGAIEAVWELLVAKEGRLLHRFLSRFRHTATVPDPFLMSAFRGADAEIATVAAANNRIPYSPLWPPVLKALQRHGAEVIDLADVELAEAFDLWLRRGPSEDGQRPGCALLVLEGAERILVQAAEPRTYISGELVKAHLHAALAAVREEPLRVRALVEQFINPEPAAAPPPGAGAPTARAQRLIEFDPFGDEEGSPPRIGVGALEAFRELCLDTDALYPVMDADPDLAAEVISATILPRRIASRRWRHPLEDYGVPAFYKWSSPLWMRGPFMRFLRVAPQRAIAMIVAITNEATSRYLTALEDEERAPESVITIEVDGEERQWLGDEIVYLWYRGDARGPNTVASALMALEKWLYELIEAEEDIGPAVEQVMSESRSLAFAGLLVAVGFRRSGLFKGPLRPLLGVSDLYRFDHIRTTQIAGQFRIGLFMEPQLMQSMLAEWHEMKHRRIELEQAAQQMLLADSELAAWMTGPLARWRKEDREVDRHLTARLDISNWIPKTLPNGTEAWEYQHPPELAEESAEAMAEMNEQLFWIEYPNRMRRAIDGGEEDPTEEQFEEFWHSIVEARAMKEPPAEVLREGVFAARDARCGVAAWLVLRAREWLRSHPEREGWCRDTLLEGAMTPLKPHFMDSPHDVSDWSYDRFCADALPTLWADDPGDRQMREALAILATNHHYNTISRLYAAAARLRETLGPSFIELQSLAMPIARWKTRRTLATQTDDEKAAKQALGDLEAFLERFAEGELEEIAPEFEGDTITVPEQPGQLLGRRRRRRRTRRMIDLAHIWAAWSWMPEIDEALEGAERERWFAVWRAMIAVIVTRIESEGGDSGSGPFDYENGVLLALAARVLDLAEAQEARSLWQPLLAAGPDGERWISTFLTAWFGQAVTEGRPAPRLAARWEEMLAFASESWSQDSGTDSEANWRSLLAIGRWQSAELWGAEMASVIERLAGFYERWAELHLREPESFAAFCRFLSAKAAKPLIESGLMWLERTSGAEGVRTERGEQDLISLLATIAGRNPDLPRADSAAGVAYRALLARAVERHDPLALALNERIFGTEGPDAAI
jgi:hypothetical protein